MKKFITVLLSSLLVVALFAGCSSTDDDATVDDDTTNEETTIDDEVLEVGVIYAASSPDYPPYESYDTDGNIVGFEVDLLNAMANYIQTEDGTTYTIEWVAMDFSTIISAIQTGQVDIGVSGFSYSEERAEQVLFTDSVDETTQIIVVKADSDIETLDDLNGMLVGAQTGTTCYDAASEIEGVTMVGYDNNQTMFELLKNDQVDAIAVDYEVAAGYVESSDDYKIIEEPIYEDSVGVICALGNTALQAALNEALAAVKESGEYDELKAAWGLE